MHCSLVNAQVVTMSVTVPVGRCVLLRARRTAWGDATTRCVRLPKVVVGRPTTQAI